MKLLCSAAVTAILLGFISYWLGEDGSIKIQLAFAVGTVGFLILLED